MITKRNKRNKNREIRKKRTRRNHKKKYGGSGKMTSDELREANLRMMKEALGEVNKPRKRKVEEVEEENPIKKIKEVVPLPEAPKIQPIVVEATSKIIENLPSKTRKTRKSTSERNEYQQQKVALLIEKGMEHPKSSLQRSFAKYSIKDMETMDLPQLHEIYGLWRVEESIKRRDIRIGKRDKSKTQKSKTQKSKTQKSKTQHEEDQEMIDDMIYALGDEEEQEAIEKTHAGVDATPKKLRMRYTGDVEPGPSIPIDLFGNKESIIDERKTIINPPIAVSELDKRSSILPSMEETQMINDMDEILSHQEDLTNK